MSLTSISPLIPEFNPFILSSFHLQKPPLLRPPRYARSRSNPAVESQVQHREGSLKHGAFFNGLVEGQKNTKNQKYSMVKKAHGFNGLRFSHFPNKTNPIDKLVGRVTHLENLWKPTIMNPDGELDIEKHNLQTALTSASSLEPPLHGVVVQVSTISMVHSCLEKVKKGTWCKHINNKKNEKKNTKQ